MLTTSLQPSKIVICADSVLIWTSTEASAPWGAINNAAVGGALKTYSCHRVCVVCVYV